MNKVDSKHSSSCAVKSKYFTTETVMDESLSEFQETKKHSAGPKSNVKSANSKPRKAPKRIRGQKDIRTALNSKKSDLESYSEDFNKECKKAGIDVDSEQLQLAIALSKSLQDTATTSSETCENSQSVIKQERIGKIRTTLKEYGFKIPEAKIKGNTRKLRKHRKNYKLILATDTEKKEIIANKYSHVLFRNIAHFGLYISDIDVSKTPLYYLASNATYELLKARDKFYVSNLIEKSITTGNLFRDWSEIPGRPVSPKMFAPSDMNFSEIECSQDEIDIVLSGTLKSCKNIIYKKSRNLIGDVTCKIVVENIKNTEDEINNHETSLKLNSESTNNLVETLSVEKSCRSCSPDIFDDDASFDCTVFDNTKSSAVETRNSLITQNTVTETDSGFVNIRVQDEILFPDSVCENPSSAFLNMTKRKSNDLMELTECIQIPSKHECTILNPTGSQSSQNTNITKRRSNDYMEITNCVATSSQAVKSLDLTQSLDIDRKNTDRNKDKNHENRGKYCNSNSKPEMLTNPIISMHNGSEITISLENHDDYIELDSKIPKEVNLNKSIECMDLTQSSSSSDELPFVSLTAAKNNSLDDTIIVDINEYVHKKTTNSQNEAEVYIDLTQNFGKVNDGTIHFQSFFENNNHDHSDNTEELKKGDSDKSELENNDLNKLDLIQAVEKSSSNNNTHSNNFQEPIRGNVAEQYSNSQLESNSENVDLTQSSRKSTSSRLNSLNIVEEPVPVEYHRSNCGYRYCKPGKVDLTLSPIKQSHSNELNDIDLTQSSNTSEDLSQSLTNYDPSKATVDNITIEKLDANFLTKEDEITTVKNSQSYSSLGKKDDVSIDYDDILNTEAINEVSDSKNATSESVTYEINDENLKEHSKNNSLISNCSQNSEVFEISDKELDYSLLNSKLEIPRGNFIFGGISIMDEISNYEASNKSLDNGSNFIANNLNEIEADRIPAATNKNKKSSKELSPIKHRRITEIATPQKACSGNMVTVVTPKNSELIIKTDNVTPMLNYASMSTPDIHKELDKYGIKPFKRKRAIQLLTHIYNQTHPIIEAYTDELASPPKRHKPNDQPTASLRKHISPRKLLKSPRKDEAVATNVANKSDKNIPETIEGKNNKSNRTRKIKNSLQSKNKIPPDGIDMGKNDVENVRSKSTEVVYQTDETPIIRNIECKPEDWVFQKREKANVHSCRVPLHIAFHNYVSSRRDLREAILCYEPVEIDVIHKDLVGYGHRYDPKDLLKFLDKKCITVKTTDNDARNHKR